MTAYPDVPPGVDPTRPSPARLYDYFLGGTHNFPADREAAERLKASVPDTTDAVLANRAELVPPYPGADRLFTYVGLWGAEDIEAADTEGPRGIYCGVARRP